MEKTEDGFGKKRNHNQYGPVGKDKDKSKRTDLPKPANKQGKE